MGVLKIRADGATRKIGCGGGGGGGSNALTNPGAESGTTGYVIYFGDTLTAPSTPLHSGSASFAITRTITSGTFSHLGMRSDQSLPVTPGQSYGLSGWVRTNGWSADYPTLMIEFLDSFGAYLGGILDNPAATIDGTAWAFISTSAVAPSGSVQARLTWDVGAPYQSLGPGTYIGYFDDLSFTAPTPPGRLKLYADGRIWQEACDTTTGFLDLFERTSSTTPGADYAVFAYSGHGGVVWGTDGHAAYIVSIDDDAWNSIALCTTAFGTSGYVEAHFPTLTRDIGLTAAATMTPFGVTGHAVYASYQPSYGGSPHPGWFVAQHHDGLFDYDYVVPTVPPQAGDIMRLDVTGIVVTLSCNGTVIFTRTLSNPVPTGAQYWGMHGAHVDSGRIGALAINRPIGRPLKLWDGTSIRTVRVTPA